MGIEALAMSSIAMSTAGAITGATGSYYQSQANQAAYNYQAQVAQNNRQYGEWQAQDAIRRGQIAENVSRSRTAQLRGTQRASLAARGIALDEGSALNILSDTDFMGDLDALMIRDNAAREAWGLREQGKSQGADAILMRGRANAESPLFSGASSLLAGAGQVASQWYRYRATQE